MWNHLENWHNSEYFQTVHKEQLMGTSRILHRKWIWVWESEEKTFQAFFRHQPWREVLTTGSRLSPERSGEGGAAGRGRTCRFIHVFFVSSTSTPNLINTNSPDIFIWLLTRWCFTCHQCNVFNVSFYQNILVHEERISCHLLKLLVRKVRLTIGNEVVHVVFPARTEKHKEVGSVVLHRGTETESGSECVRRRRPTMWPWAGCNAAGSCCRDKWGRACGLCHDRRYTCRAERKETALISDSTVEQTGPSAERPCLLSHLFPPDMFKCTCVFPLSLFWAFNSLNKLNSTEEKLRQSQERKESDSNLLRPRPWQEVQRLFLDRPFPWQKVQRFCKTTRGPELCVLSFQHYYEAVPFFFLQAQNVSVAWS